MFIPVHLIFGHAAATGVTHATSTVAGHAANAATNAAVGHVAHVAAGKALEASTTHAISALPILPPSHHALHTAAKVAAEGGAVAFAAKAMLLFEKKFLGSVVTQAVMRTDTAQRIKARATSALSSQLGRSA